MPKLENAQIELARTRMYEALDILRGAGYGVLRVGNAEFSLKEHDSMRINVDKNCYIRNSDGSKGDAIKILQEYCGLQFREAVQQLTPEYRDSQTVIKQNADRKIYSTSTPQRSIPKEENEVYTLSADNRRAAAYLQRTRGIDSGIVSELIHNGKVRQDERNNAVFRIFDEQGNWKGAELVGTNTFMEKKFKQSTAETGYGFTIDIGTPSKVCFFESAIDAISYYDLHKDNLKDVALVSLAGVTKTKTLFDTVERMKEQHGISNENIWLCVDRDEAGLKLIKDCKEQLQGCKAYITPDVNCKDWNELLLSVRAKEKEQGRAAQHFRSGWNDLCERDKQQDIGRAAEVVHSHSETSHNDR